MPEVAILIGLQAAGKTTFYRQLLAATHQHVSKDAFRHNRNRQRRQLQLITEALQGSRNVAVDNTNPSPQEWEPIISVAHAFDACVVGYWFPPDLATSLRRNATRNRPVRVPDVGVFATFKRLRAPRRDDGFDRLIEVRSDDRGGFAMTLLASWPC
jgi:predicted kinase